MTAPVMAGEPWTYFGLWPAKDALRASDLLISLGVLFTIHECRASDEVLKEWLAWDATAADPTIAFELWIRSDDLPAARDRTAAMFPERTFVTG